MANSENISAAAKEVRDAQKELQASEQEISKLEYAMFEAGRRYDLAKIRVEEANRVLVESASE